MEDNLSEHRHPESASLLPKVALQPLTDLLGSEETALRRAVLRVANEARVPTTSYTAFGNAPAPIDE